MTAVTVVSACYGGYDTVAPFPTQTGVDTDAVMVTDVPVDVPGWRNVVEERGHLPPRMAAKPPRARPDLYTDADVTVWVDASLEIRSSRFAAWCVEHLGGAAVAACAHPYHTTIEQEAALAATLPKYVRTDVIGQVKHYERQGHPPGWGVWWTGLIVTRTSRATRAFGDLWLAEMLTWSAECQISFPYAARSTVGRPATLPFHGWVNSMFALRQHTKAV